jgi:hypothetical protein
MRNKFREPGREHEHVILPILFIHGFHDFIKILSYRWVVLVRNHLLKLLVGAVCVEFRWAAVNKNAKELVKGFWFQEVT